VQSQEQKNSKGGHDYDRLFTALTWGSDEVIVTYDRLANGWSGAPGPNGDVDRVFSVVLKVSV
jgi:hypothetical protein